MFAVEAFDITRSKTDRLALERRSLFRAVPNPSLAGEHAQPAAAFRARVEAVEPMLVQFDLRTRVRQPDRGVFGTAVPVDDRGTAEQLYSNVRNIVGEQTNRACGAETQHASGRKHNFATSIRPGCEDLARLDSPELGSVPVELPACNKDPAVKMMNKPGAG